MSAASLMGRRALFFFPGCVAGRFLTVMLSLLMIWTHFRALPVRMQVFARHEKLVSPLQNAYHIANGLDKNTAGLTSGMKAMTGRDLSDLWSSAIIFAPHLAGCMCAGGFHVPLDAAAVEQDLIEYLAYRYKSEGLAALAAFTESRVQERKSSFNIWLREIDEAALAKADRARLIADIRTTLESMQDMGAAQRGQIVCY